MIVGAPKAGTTSLCHYLSEHPQVFMSNPKEVNYFSKKEIELQGLYYNDFRVKNLKEYNKLFESVVDEKAVGEGSVSYLFYPQTPYKIKATIPNIKIIILLRCPVERSYSHYLMDYRMGLVDLPFEDIVFRRGENKNIDLFYQQYVELGFYYEQVKRYLDIFGYEKVKICLQDDLRIDANKIISDLYDFLGIDKSFVPDFKRNHNSYLMPKNKIIHKIYASKIIRSLMSQVFSDVLKEKIKDFFFERKIKPKVNKKVKIYLRDLYKNDIHKLEYLIGNDLSNWYKQ